MKRTRVLVVDDEANVLKFVASNLRAAGYDVLTAQNGRTGLELGLAESLDLIVLDLRLPGVDGLEVCRCLRAVRNTPIIVLSVKNREVDKVQALNLGADDYLTKPFGVAELLARVRAVLRRSQRRYDEADEVLSVGQFTLDPKISAIIADGKETALTPTEFSLLHCLMAHAGKIVSQKQLLEHVWGPEYRGQTEYIRVYIGRLRQKIEPNPSAPRHLLTRPGAGYLFTANPTALPARRP